MACNRHDLHHRTRHHAHIVTELAGRFSALGMALARAPQNVFATFVKSNRQMAGVAQEDGVTAAP
jgi:hypothetical protein